MTDDGDAIQKNLGMFKEQTGVELTKFNEKKFKVLLLERKELLQQHRLEAALV